MKNIIKSSLIAGLAVFAGMVSYAQQGAQQAPAQPEAVCPMGKALDKLSVGLSVAYEGQYNFRGIKEAGKSIQSELSIEYAATEDFALYATAWDNEPIDGDKMSNELDLTIGATYSVENFTFDVGYSYYWYLESDKHAGEFGSTNELAFGVAYDASEILSKISEKFADLEITPSLYYYYDIDLLANTIEFAIDFTIPVSKWILGEEKDFLAIESKIYCGWSESSRYMEDGEIYDETDGYSYVGVSADLVYSITSYCNLSLGVRYTANDAGYGNENNVWFGAGCNFGF